MSKVRNWIKYLTFFKIYLHEMTLSDTSPSKLCYWNTWKVHKTSQILSKKVRFQQTDGWVSTMFRLSWLLTDGHVCIASVNLQVWLSPGENAPLQQSQHESWFFPDAIYSKYSTSSITDILYLIHTHMLALFEHTDARKPQSSDLTANRL